MYSELKNLDLSLLGGPRLAEVGKIKIGGKGKKVTSKKGAQFRVPEKYDHFVITTNFKDPRTDDFVVDCCRPWTDEADRTADGAGPRQSAFYTHHAAF